MICKSCGTVCTGQPTPRGSGLIEVVLWLTFIIPIALVYSIWRRVNTRPACPACGGQELVSPATPVGRRLAAEHYPGGLPAPVGPVVRPVARPKAILAAVAVFIGWFVLLALLVGPLTV